MYTHAQRVPCGGNGGGGGGGGGDAVGNEISGNSISQLHQTFNQVHIHHVTSRNSSSSRHRDHFFYGNIFDNARRPALECRSLLFIKRRCNYPNVSQKLPMSPISLPRKLKCTQAAHRNQSAKLINSLPKYLLTAINGVSLHGSLTRFDVITC